ncbi:hypothetical protein B0H12DRAFT_1246481 [Mycena haematopus]|nr:hypothetical protein B0H12DRAFT_1246481 [Mycena haematopus]
MLPTTIQHNSPYAEAQPPPPPVVMLLSATELYLPAFHTLLSQEDLTMTAPVVAKPASKVKSLAFAQAAPATEVKPGPSSRAPSSRRSAPPPSGAPPSERADSPLTAIDGDESGSGDSSDSDSRATTPRIARPKGLTRVSLAKHSAWEEGPDVTTKITSHVHTLANKYLNPSKSFTDQDRTKLKEVYSRAKIAYPQLKDYANNWPVACILQAHLKITKLAAKNSAVAALSRKITGAGASKKKRT